MKKPKVIVGLERRPSIGSSLDRRGKLPNLAALMKREHGAGLRRSPLLLPGLDFVHDGKPWQNRDFSLSRAQPGSYELRYLTLVRAEPRPFGAC